MHARSLALAFMFIVATTSTVLAQYPDGGGGPGGGGFGGRHRHGMMGDGPGGGMKQLDPVVAEGPPAPAEFAKITTVADTQRYARLYEHFMTSTRPQRDSLANARSAMRSAFEDHDRDAARNQMDLLKSLGDDLSKQQETFDGAVKDMVKKDEWKKYQDWRAERRKEAEAQRRDMMGGRREGAAPPEVPSGNQ
jgi:hypothetical protein